MDFIVPSSNFCTLTFQSNSGYVSIAAPYL